VSALEASCLQSFHCSFSHPNPRLHDTTPCDRYEHEDGRTQWERPFEVSGQSSEATRGMPLAVSRGAVALPPLPKGWTMEGPEPGSDEVWCVTCASLLCPPPLVFSPCSYPTHTCTATLHTCAGTSTKMAGRSGNALDCLRSVKALQLIGLRNPPPPSKTAAKRPLQKA
jgi:hypothetical protein